MKNLLLLVFCSLGISSFAQQYMVYFKDKVNSEYFQLSDRSLQRRTKAHVVFDENDKQVSNEYLSQLREKGSIMKVSRWLNAVVYESDFSPEELMAEYNFIDHIVSTQTNQRIKKELDPIVDMSNANYGVADTQIRQIGVDCLHDQGFTGQGVYLAIIDAGFINMDSIPHFDSLFIENRILDSMNFVAPGNTVYGAHYHGTAVASCIVGEMGGANPFSGTAVDVDVALYLTEDVGSETLVEEFNLVMALERCDSVGVDVANISLGYKTFDDSLQNHTYADLDGQSTPAAIGVNTAATKGILVVTSAGNSGPDFISTPGDADSVLCVGAVDNQGNYAPFSSVGPNSDGQVKPDVMATGWGAWVVLDNGSVVMGNGTSFASPITAGAVACLIQANPTRSAFQVKDWIRRSASLYNTPNDTMGYGIPDFCLANDSLQVLAVEQMESDAFSIYPNPATDELMIITSLPEYSVSLINSIGETVYVGRAVKQIDLTQFGSGLYVVVIHTRDNILRKKLIIR